MKKIVVLNLFIAGLLGGSLAVAADAPASDAKKLPTYTKATEAPKKPEVIALTEKPRNEAVNACNFLKPGQECTYSPGAGQTVVGICADIPKNLNSSSDYYCGIIKK